MKAPWMRAALGASLLAVALLGCSNDPDAPELSEQAVPDFGLLDANPNSPTTGTTIAVRDHLGAVSAWYFAHAT